MKQVIKEGVSCRKEPESQKELDKLLTKVIKILNIEDEITKNNEKIKNERIVKEKESEKRKLEEEKLKEAKKLQKKK